LDWFFGLRYEVSGICEACVFLDQAHLQGAAFAFPFLSFPFLLLASSSGELHTAVIVSVAGDFYMGLMEDDREMQS